MEVVRELGLILSAKGPDSSVGGVTVGNCPDVDHMEEEVQVSVQVEEEGIGETHGRNRARNRESKNGRPHNVDDHADEMTRSCRHLRKCGVSHIMKDVRCAREKVTCEVYCPHISMTLNHCLLPPSDSEAPSMTWCVQFLFL